jgi:hypothetical protein
MLLLSLVGEQPIPNLLPLWQAPDEYTAVKFAATHTTQAVAENLAHAIRGDPQLGHLEVLEPLLLEAYDIGQARAALAQELVIQQLQEQPVRINLTGGTKLMSLAAVQAAYGTGLTMLYVSTEENQVICLASDGSEQSRQPICVRISVEQYLAAHGLEAGSDLSFKPERSFAGAPPREGNLLEERVHRLLLESRVFDDVRRGVFIRKQTEHGAVVNELDVCAALNGRLVVCSCKSGKVNKEDIYELASLSRREAAGIYCGKVLVSDQPDLAPALRQRAHTMNVRLVYGKDIPHIAEHIRLTAR